ncbi:unnamed protein product [Nesidiocoris tenuis]|uniref:RWD domain-containing protein n=1 Tax=Nesidiocoris tenuis TaxID=355587 RepID=A0A6H5HUY6_9HEMI|nr:unnamed protein product [Nesidiocoris tenuis]
MSDQEEQDDEACVLQSIYNEEELAITTEEDGLKSGKFFAFVNLPKGFCIKYKARFDDSEFLVVPVDHLPPILLSFKLPKNYPSESMPEFTLSCVWMTVRKAILRLELTWKRDTVVLRFKASSTICYPAIGSRPIARIVRNATRRSRNLKAAIKWPAGNANRTSAGFVWPSSTGTSPTSISRTPRPAASISCSSGSKTMSRSISLTRLSSSKKTTTSCTITKRNSWMISIRTTICL